MTKTHKLIKGRYSQLRKDYEEVTNYLKKFYRNTNTYDYQIKLRADIFDYVFEKIPFNVKITEEFDETEQTSEVTESGTTYINGVGKVKFLKDKFISSLLFIKLKNLPNI